MKVAIICNDFGWIYEKFVKMLKKYSRHEIVLNDMFGADLVHYMPYYELGKKPNVPCTAWFSHQEKRKDLYNKFVSTAKNVDFAISQSKKYLSVIKEIRCDDKCAQVKPGVDQELYFTRSTKRMDNSKLVVAYVGRQYSSSNRKNPGLLKRISKAQFVDFRATNGKIKEYDVPRFYRNADIVVSPALVEGGPMCLHESLLIGTPCMCFESVGVSDEFDTGVIKVPLADDNAFIKRLFEFWKSKEYLEYRKPNIMREMRSQVLDMTWESFAAGHDDIWESLCGNR